MDTTGLTAFDIVVLATILISTLFAFGRGFVTVALSFASWGGAFFTAVLGFDIVVPYVREWITQNDLANITTFILLFFLSLFIFKQIAEWVGGKVKSSFIGFLDRSLGALFGMLRGYVVVCVAYLAINAFIGSTQPDWLRDAKTRDFVHYGAEMVASFTKDILGDEDSGAADLLERAAAATPNQFEDAVADAKDAIVDKVSQAKLDQLIEDISGDEDSGS